MKNCAKAARSMNALAYATANGKTLMQSICLKLCKRYGANKNQIGTAQEHGRNVAAGIDYPNWK